MSHPWTQPSRRIVFHGLGALGVAAVLAGCGGGGDEGGDAADGTGGTVSGTVLATTDEVPLGGGVVLTDAQVVVTQPAEGEFRAFAAVCTHQGAALDTVSDEGIACPLHGSRFSVEDGAATKGPATEPLAELALTLDGDRILVA